MGFEISATGYVSSVCTKGPYKAHARFGRGGPNESARRATPCFPTTYHNTNITTCTECSMAHIYPPCSMSLRNYIFRAIYFCKYFSYDDPKSVCRGGGGAFL
jgi:hypothetical protein